MGVGIFWASDLILFCSNFAQKIFFSPWSNLHIIFSNRVSQERIFSGKHYMCYYLTLIYHLNMHAIAMRLTQPCELVRVAPAGCLGFPSSSQALSSHCDLDWVTQHCSAGFLQRGERWTEMTCVNTCSLRKGRVLCDFNSEAWGLGYARTRYISFMGHINSILVVLKKDGIGRFYSIPLRSM